MSETVPTLFNTIYNPDVLSCIANLSNDEVFTPPEVANAMLDMLPQELFKDPNTKFLDPACKSGVFLREIAKRLLIGLEDTKDAFLRPSCPCEASARKVCTRCYSGLSP